MYIVDALGLVCPKPVIMAKKALKEYDEIKVQVDNPTSRENLEKMAVVMGLDYETFQEGNVYSIVMKKNGSMQAVASGETPVQQVVYKPDDSYIVVCASNVMGTGSDELGGALMKSFIYTLTEADKLPDTVIFYNGGVHLTCKGSPCLEDLKTLEAAGVEILSCGTCLNYYGKTDDLAVGSVTNMYVIVQRQQEAARIIRV